MAFFQKNRPTKHRIGLGFVVSQIVLICLLLVLNGFLVRHFINLDWGEELRIAQAIQLLLPVALLFVEFWLFDMVFARTTQLPT